MKKLFLVFIIGTLLISALGCQYTPTSGTEDLGFKIGIVTGTVSQGEEEFQTGANMVVKYGSNNIKHVTYPDKFATEVETTVAQISGLASDEDVKAIIICQAVPGTAAAIDKIRESRDDILFILGVPHEDPEVIASRGDIILELDQLQRGVDIIEKAKEMGATTFVHYSFPRHMSYELLAARRDIFKETAERLDMKFVALDAPDPSSDAGTSGAQQFIMEDVPRQIDALGKDTAFFSTNCSMMEPLIRQTLEFGAIFPEQCCPSPYHAYPGALGIEIPQEEAGNLDYLYDQISQKIEAKGGAGRFGTWKKPANVSIIEAGVKYAIDFANGDIERFDKARMVEYLKEVTDDKDNEVIVTELNEDNPHFLLFVLGYKKF